MKIVKCDARVIDEPNPLKKVELVGRTCYKSEDKITDDSCYSFVSRLISRQHYAMLEHAELTYEIECSQLPDEFMLIPFARISSKHVGGVKYYYVTVSLSHLYRQLDLSNPISQSIMQSMKALYLSKYVEHNNDATNTDEYCIGKNELEADMTIRLLPNVQAIRNFCKEDWDLHASCTIKLITDRGVSHEAVRHRCSVAQESTRYCLYSNDKFGGQLSYVLPSTLESWPDEAKDLYMKELEHDEQVYIQLTNEYGLSAQQARAVLNNSTKTDVILTMPVYQWKHFFAVRAHGETGAPHPDMKEVAIKAKKAFLSWENMNY